MFMRLTVALLIAVPSGVFAQSPLNGEPYRAALQLVDDLGFDSASALGFRPRSGLEGMGHPVELGSRLTTFLPRAGDGAAYGSAWTGSRLRRATTCSRRTDRAINCVIYGYYGQRGPERPMAALFADSVLIWLSLADESGTVFDAGYRAFMMVHFGSPRDTTDLTTKAEQWRAPKALVTRVLRGDRSVIWVWATPSTKAASPKASPKRVPRTRPR